MRGERGESKGRRPIWRINKQSEEEAERLTGYVLYYYEEKRRESGTSMISVKSER
jgi:hypothetical protein